MGNCDIYRIRSFSFLRFSHRCETGDVVMCLHECEKLFVSLLCSNVFILMWETLCVSITKMAILWRKSCTSGFLDRQKFWSGTVKWLSLNTRAPTYHPNLNSFQKVSWKETLFGNRLTCFKILLISWLLQRLNSGFNALHRGWGT